MLQDSCEPLFIYGVRESAVYVGDLRAVCVLQAVCVLYAQAGRITLVSADVIHAFAIPVCSVKSDVVPGRCNVLGVGCVAGSVHGQCSEICGAFHGFMPVGLFGGVSSAYARPCGGCSGGARRKWRRKQSRCRLAGLQV